MRINGYLTEAQEQAGLWLEAPDDHILQLVLRGKLIAVFSQDAATAKSIKTFAKQVQLSL